jgi:hypothetical protein
MNATSPGARVLVVFALVALLVGTLDPLEGSVLILLGIAVFTLEAWLSASRHRRAISWSLVLAAVGTAALFGLSSVGGLGGGTGRSYWWVLVLLPYPAGWLLGLVTGLRQVRDAFRRPAIGTAH